jgi:hypothetical protein
VERVAAPSSLVDRMTDVRALSSEKWRVRGSFSEETA